jgi:hypothetical protein
VDPLVVSRCFGKLVDAMLVDDGPFGQTDLFAFASSMDLIGRMMVS